jgi:hypothetical protein
MTFLCILLFISCVYNIIQAFKIEELETKIDKALSMYIDYKIKYWDTVRKRGPFDTDEY